MPRTWSSILRRLWGSLLCNLISFRKVWYFSFVFDNSDVQGCTQRNRWDFIDDCKEFEYHLGQNWFISVLSSKKVSWLVNMLRIYQDNPEDILRKSCEFFSRIDNEKFPGIGSKKLLRIVYENFLAKGLLEIPLNLIQEILWNWFW